MPQSELNKTSVPLPQSDKADPSIQNRRASSNKLEGIARSTEIPIDNSSNRTHSADTIYHLQQPYPNYPYQCQLPVYGKQVLVDIINQFVADKNELGINLSTSQMK